MRSLFLVCLFALGALVSCVGPTPSSPPRTPKADPGPVVARPPEPEPFEVLLEEARTATVAESAPPPDAPSPTPVEAAPSRSPLKLLILGDSMAATDFGHALEDVLSGDARVQTARRGKSSTGLARPDFFDWMVEGPKQVELHDPHVVIVILGGNDGQDLLRTTGRARVHWGSKAWPGAYAGRLTALAESLSKGRRKVVFLGLPLMDRPRLEKKLRLIRGVQEQAFAGDSVATYVDTRSCFLSKTGKPLKQVQVPGYKTPQPLRQEDGIHLTVPGARHFANCAQALLAPILAREPSAAPLPPS